MVVRQQDVIAAFFQRLDRFHSVAGLIDVVSRVSQRRAQDHADILVILYNEDSFSISLHNSSIRTQRAYLLAKQGPDLDLSSMNNDGAGILCRSVDRSPIWRGRSVRCRTTCPSTGKPEIAKLSQQG